MEEKYVKLWSDNSNDSKLLQKILEDKGYTVKHILSASPEPVLREGSNLISGLGRIVNEYQLRDSFK
jgi:hypothetical protein